MSLGRSLLLGLVATTFVVACRRKTAPLSDGEACDRIAGLNGSTWTPADKDRCYLTYSEVGPNVRACTDTCIRHSANAADFDDCRDDCTGTVYPSYMVCQKIAVDGRRVDACRQKHDPLVSEAKDVYKCWSRCGRRAATAIEAEGCDKVCSVPE